jgi:hypothetical protein
MNTQIVVLAIEITERAVIRGGQPEAKAFHPALTRAKLYRYEGLFSQQNVLLGEKLAHFEAFLHKGTS